MEIALHRAGYGVREFFMSNDSRHGEGGRFLLLILVAALLFCSYMYFEHPDKMPKLTFIDRNIPVLAEKEKQAKPSRPARPAKPAKARSTPQPWQHGKWKWQCHITEDPVFTDDRGDICCNRYWKPKNQRKCLTRVHARSLH